MRAEGYKWADLLTGFSVKIPNEPLHSITQISFLPSFTAEGAETNQQLLFLYYFPHIEMHSNISHNIPFSLNNLYNEDQTKTGKQETVRDLLSIEQRKFLFCCNDSTVTV